MVSTATALNSGFRARTRAATTNVRKCIDDLTAAAGGGRTGRGSESIMHRHTLHCGIYRYPAAGTEFRPANIAHAFRDSHRCFGIPGADPTSRFRSGLDECIDDLSPSDNRKLRAAQCSRVRLASYRIEYDPIQSPTRTFHENGVNSQL